MFTLQPNSCTLTKAQWDSHIYILYLTEKGICLGQEPSLHAATLLQPTNTIYLHVKMFSILPVQYIFLTTILLHHMLLRLKDPFPVSCSTGSLADTSQHELHSICYSYRYMQLRMFSSNSNTEILIPSKPPYSHCGKEDQETLMELHEAVLLKGNLSS